MNLKSWLNRHRSAIEEVRPLSHAVFRDRLLDRAAFDSWLGLDAEGDGEHWITTKNGHHVLLDDDGTVKAGMGGKFNGEKIEAHKGSAKTSSTKQKYSASSNPKEYDDLWRRTYFDGEVSRPKELDEALREKRDLPKKEQGESQSSYERRVRIRNLESSKTARSLAKNNHPASVKAEARISQSDLSKARSDNSAWAQSRRADIERRREAAKAARERRAKNK